MFRSKGGGVVGGGRGQRERYVVSCMAVVFRSYALASLQSRDGVRLVFNDQAEGYECLTSNRVSCFAHNRSSYR